MKIPNNHADRDHALLSPSGIHKAIKCPGSVVLEELLPAREKDGREPSVYAEEGTRGHECSEYDTAKLVGIKGFPKPEHYDDNPPEMIQYGKDYAKFCKERLDEFLEHHEPLTPYPMLETRVIFSNNIWGTLDFGQAGVHKKTGEPRALLVDYKYGQGINVSAQDNSQLLTYAVCLNEVVCPEKVFEKAYIYIYQPRTGTSPWDRWTAERDNLVAWKRQLQDLEAFVEGLFEDLSPLTAAMENLNAGDLKHCRFCRAKPACPAFRKAVNATAVQALDAAPSFSQRPELFETHSLLDVYEKKKAIETFLKDVERELMHRMKNGEHVDGYKLVKGRQTRKFIKDEKKVAAHLKELGCKRAYKRSLVTIGEVEKQIGKKKADLLEPVIERTEGKLQIAPLEDKRTAEAVLDSAEVLTELPKD